MRLMTVWRGNLTIGRKWFSKQIFGKIEAPSMPEHVIPLIVVLLPRPD